MQYIKGETFASRFFVCSCKSFCRKNIHSTLAVEKILNQRNRFFWWFLYVDFTFLCFIMKLFKISVFNFPTKSKFFSKPLWTFFCKGENIFGLLKFLASPWKFCSQYLDQNDYKQSLNRFKMLPTYVPCLGDCNSTFWLAWSVSRIDLLVIGLTFGKVKLLMSKKPFILLLQLIQDLSNFQN